MVSGDDLRKAREAQHISLYQMAERIRKSAGHLSRIEREADGRTPSPGIVRLYEGVLGVKVAATVAPVHEHVHPSNLDDVNRRDLLTTTASAAAAGPVSLALAASDARTAALFARQIVQGAVDDLTIEQIDADTRQLARQYVSQPLTDLFGDIRHLRCEVFTLLERNRLPLQMRPLYLVASRLCGLQAHVCLDLGYYSEADTHARAALQAARAAGHHGAYAWVRSLQSLIAYWDGRPSDAIRLTDEALEYAQDLSTAVRLPALQARAAAALGDTTLALRALVAADQARNSSLPDDDIGGVFSFPEAKHAAYAGTALLALGQPELATRAIEESTRALGLYKIATPAERSSGDTLAAYLDLATAYLAADDLEGTAEHLGFVLETEPNRRTASIRKRARTLAGRLTASRFAESRIGSQLYEGLIAFDASRPELTSTPHGEPQ